MTEMNIVTKVDGAICKKPSKFFKGACGRDADCEKACDQENWPGGVCVPFLRCECQRSC